MLYFIYGSDSARAIAKAREVVESLRKKKPDAAFFKMDDESFDAGRLTELIGGQGLFERHSIILMSRVFENREAKGAVLGKLNELAMSRNVFIIREAVCDKATAEEIRKVAAKTQEFVKEETDGPVEENFNIFSLADALGRRDKRTLWVLYEKALRRGVSPEEIHGVLFWQIKCMIMAAAARNAATAGLKPFVFAKAKRYAGNFSEAELQKISSRLVAVYHDARAGGPELDIALERFMLTI